MKQYDFRTTALAVLAVFVAASHVEASTLEFASVTSGGGVTSNGSVLVVGQAAVGTMSNASFTIEVGIVSVFAGAACPASSAPTAELIGVDVSTKNRFLSFSAGDAGQMQAVRVTFGSLMPPYNIWDGAELWVGPTREISQAGANVAPTPGFPNFTAAALQCEPFYADWSSLGTVHVFHEGIVPDGIYLVDVIVENCNAGVSGNFSDALPMSTAIWGDTVRNLAETPPLPPEGAVNVSDALAVLGRFASAPTSIVKPRADLEPACLDMKIDISDVLSSLSGFAGLSYPFAPSAADPCDSTCMNGLR